MYSDICKIREIGSELGKWHILSWALFLLVYMPLCGLLYLADMIGSVTKGRVVAVAIDFKEFAIEWFRRRGWGPALIPLGFILVWVWLTPGFSLALVSPSISKGVLMSIGQTLAAVLALVFTISLIAAQLSSRYSARVLETFFDFWTTGYILLFVLSSLFAIWMASPLNPTTDEYLVDLGLRLSFSLAAACLLFLIPYLLSFKERLNPNSVLELLKHRSSKEISIRFPDPTAEPLSDEEMLEILEPDAFFNLRTIDDYIMTALGEYDYATFDKGFRVLQDLYNAHYGNIGARELVNFLANEIGGAIPINNERAVKYFTRYILEVTVSKGVSNETKVNFP